MVTVGVYPFVDVSRPAAGCWLSFRESVTIQLVSSSLSRSCQRTSNSNSTSRERERGESSSSRSSAFAEKLRNVRLICKVGARGTRWPSPARCARLWFRLCSFSKLTTPDWTRQNFTHAPSSAVTSIFICRAMFRINRLRSRSQLFGTLSRVSYRRLYLRGKWIGICSGSDLRICRYR